MISHGTVFCLGLSQLVSWGITYYLIGGFGETIAATLGWSAAVVHGGFAVGLLVMGASSTLCGRLIDRHGGRNVMSAGSLLNAVGCAGIALGDSVWGYYAAWICLGLGMRLTLYDAAFAALVRIGGPAARRPIAQITLLGGLASTVFWPLGHLLEGALGWRGALLVYAGFALLTIPLHAAIPQARHADHPGGDALPHPLPLATGRPALVLAGALYALLAASMNVLNAGMSAHMIGMLAGLGMTASAAVWVAALRGVGQSAARLADILFGGWIHPLALNLFAASLLPLAFIAAYGSGESDAAAIAFAFLYGAGNGLLTITRGTLPLVLFDHRSYGAFVGQLLAPSFVLSAAAPLAYAVVIGRFGAGAAVHLSIALAAVMVAAAMLLRIRFHRSTEPASATAAKQSA